MTTLTRRSGVRPASNDVDQNVPNPTDHAIGRQHESRSTKFAQQYEPVATLRSRA